MRKPNTFDDLYTVLRDIEQQMISLQRQITDLQKRVKALEGKK